MAIVIILVIAAIFFILSFYRVRWGVFGLVAALPLYVWRAEVGGLPTTLLEGLVVALVVAALVRWFWDQRQKKARKFSFGPWYGYLLLLMAVAAAIFLSADWWQGLGLFRAYFLEPWLVYFVIINFCTKKDVRYILDALGVAALLVATLAILQKLGVMSIPGDYALEVPSRATSIFDYPTAVGLFLGPIVALYIPRVLRVWKNIGWQVFYLMVLGLSCVGIYLARSEGAILAVVTALVVFLLIKAYQRKKMIFGGLLIIIVLMVALGGAFFSDRLEQSNSWQVRLVIWKGASRMVAAEPFYGYGLGGFQSNYECFKENSHTEIVLYPHNLVYNFWIETGLLGLFGFVMMLVWMVYVAIGLIKRKKESFGYGLLLFAVVVAVHGLLDVPYFKNDLAMMFWLVFALAVVMVEQKRDKIHK